MHAATSDSLEDDGFLFQLYLPEGDDVSVFDRADALAGWVNHYLLGLGVTQPKLDKVTGEAGEAIDDLRNIAQLGYDEEEDQEELEMSLEEIIEYVRVAALLCHDNFTRSRSRPRRKSASQPYIKKNNASARVGRWLSTGSAKMSTLEPSGRRQALLANMQPGSAALIFAAPEVTRSADSEYPYRQNSDFWYFTGFNEPEAVLVLIKSNDTHNHSVIFNRVRDLTAEIWFGRRLGQEAAPAKLGVDRALAFSEINQQLYQLLNGLDVLYHAQGEYAYADEIVFTALDKLRKGSRQNLSAPATLTDWRPV